MRDKIVVYNNNDQQATAPVAKPKDPAPTPFIREKMTRAQAGFDGRFAELRPSNEVSDTNLLAWLMAFLAKLGINLKWPTITPMTPNNSESARKTKEPKESKLIQPFIKAISETLAKIATFFSKISDFGQNLVTSLGKPIIWAQEAGLKLQEFLSKTAQEMGRLLKLPTELAQDIGKKITLQMEVIANVLARGLQYTQALAARVWNTAQALILPQVEAIYTGGQLLKSKSEQVVDYVQDKLKKTHAHMTKTLEAVSARIKEIVDPIIQTAVQVAHTISQPIIMASLWVASFPFSLKPKGSIKNIVTQLMKVGTQLTKMGSWLGHQGKKAWSGFSGLVAQLLAPSIQYVLSLFDMLLLALKRGLAKLKKILIAIALKIASALNRTIKFILEMPKHAASVGRWFIKSFGRLTVWVAQKVGVAQ